MTTSKTGHYKLIVTAEETKKRYSLIFDKSSSNPNTQCFALMANLYKCALSSRAFTIENNLKILN